MLGGESYDRLDAVTISGDVGTAPEVDVDGARWTPARSRPRPSPRATATSSTDERRACWPPAGSATATAGDGVLAPTTRSSAELLTVNDELPAFLAGITRRQGRLRGSRSRVGRGGLRRDRQLPARHRQQGHRPRASSTWSSKVPPTSPRARSRRAPTGCRARVREGRHHRLRLRRHARSRPTTCAAVQLIEGDRAAASRRARPSRSATSARSATARSRSTRTTATERRADDVRIGTGEVIKGWDRAWSAPVGTRVILAIPPEHGYGAEGNQDSGIPANRHAGLRRRHPRRRVA